ncbi:hypothetical protein MSIMFI_04169 [Mycobacterium simulans]|nr:hypothetical protein MSIMFI_04169 [Mycobacterium simulans]
MRCVSRDPRLVPLRLPFRWPASQGVTLTDDGRFVARYGPFRAEAPLSHVRDARITGQYRWWTAVGPRLSMVDGRAHGCDLASTLLRRAGQSCRTPPNRQPAGV